MTTTTTAPAKTTIAITWTDAPTVRIKAKRDFPEYGVSKGEVVYLVRVTETPGVYYVVRFADSAWSCPCDGNAKFHRTCKHIKMASKHCKSVAQRQRDKYDAGKIWERLQAKKAWEQEQREAAARLRDAQIRAHVDAIVAAVNADLGADLVRRGFASKPDRAAAPLYRRAFSLLKSA